MARIKEYFKINDNNKENKCLDKIEKNIIIFIKQIYSDIKCILYFLKLFKSKETELSEFLNKNKKLYEEKENLDFETLEKINDYLETKEIYINNGKEDSSSIKFIGLLYNKENGINFLKTKDIDSVATLIYRLYTTTDSLQFKDILEYQCCISFIAELMNNIIDDTDDNNLLISLKNIIEKNDIDKLLLTFTNYFLRFEINVQSAKRGDLLTLEFENESESNEIFLMNTFREIYGKNSKIKYNFHNLYSVDFGEIEKMLEDILIRKSCFLKTTKINEMEYKGEDFLNDGMSELDEKIRSEKLKEKDKLEFLSFYEENLKNNIASWVEIDQELKNIIIFVNKNKERINGGKPLCDIIKEGRFTYKIKDELKKFSKKNTDIRVCKLTDLIIYLEILYFELAIENHSEYTVEKMDETTRNNIESYYNKKSGQLITKEKLSITIIKFLLNVIMNQKYENTLIDNLFDYLNNRYLWNNAIYKDSKFASECEEYKNLGIYVKNAFDFYSYISSDFKINFENKKNEFLNKLDDAKNEKIRKEKEKKREEELIKIEQENEKSEENQEKNMNVDDDDFDELDAF